MAERSQFTFYDSFYTEALKFKSKSKRSEFMDALCSYALCGIEPDFTNNTERFRDAFEACRPLLDLDRRKSIEGRKSIEYKAWRNAVFARDNYTCQQCGLRGVRLNAHHRKPYAYFPELRCSVDNGVTLCVPCHKAAHRRRYCGD